MFSTPEFWVLIAFVLLIGIFGKRAAGFLINALDKHAQKIADQLEEAQRLHDEALSLLNSYKKKHEEALAQAEKMTSAAKAEALEFKKSSEAEFEKLLAKKEKALLERIALETAETKAKLRRQAVDEALEIVETILAKEPKERKKLTKASLKEISTHVLQPVVRED